MIIKTYLGNTIDEVQEMINKDLGPNAVILTSRQIRPRGIKSLFSSKKVEITVAVEEEDYQSFQTLKSKDSSLRPHIENSHWEKNLVAIKLLLNELKTNKIEEEGSNSNKIEPENVDKKIPGIVQFLISKGMSKSLSLEIITKVFRRLGIDEMPTDSKLRTEMLNLMNREISSLIKTSGPITLNQNQTKICAFVGPTGVGKTTTLMKIALQYAQDLEKTVGIITLDGQRTGAYEQIEALTQKYNIPLAYASTISELQNTVSAYSNYDLVLIDTTGCSQYQWQKVDQLAELLSIISGLETYLVLSASTKDVDIFGAIEQFSRLNINSVIFTKLDETIANGILINVCYKSKKPLSYLTNNQQINEGLIIASPEEIGRSILVQHNTQEFDHIRQLANT